VEELTDYSAFSGWPADVLPDIARQIRGLIKDERVKKFKIGRTDNPDSRTYAYFRDKCDELRILYLTESLDNAMDVEDTLINTFYSHPKCCNIAPHSGGCISTVYSGNYVYVAIWHKSWLEQLAEWLLPQIVSSIMAGNSQSNQNMNY
jgi:hypothetical protein